MLQLGPESCRSGTPKESWRGRATLATPAEGIAQPKAWGWNSGTNKKYQVPPEAEGGECAERLDGRASQSVEGLRNQAKQLGCSFASNEAPLKA